MLLNSVKLRYAKMIFVAFLAIFAIVQIAGFVSYATKYPVEPVSDFSDFWGAAGDLRQYVKGGLLPFLYWPLKAMGLAPSICALILHVLSYLTVFVTTVYFAIFSNRPMALFRIIALSLFLLWGMIWTPLTGTVEVMMIHTSFLLCGLQFLFLSDSRRVNYLGLVFLLGAFSMRAQAMFIFAIAIAVFHVLPLILPIRRAFLYRTRLIIPCLLLAVLVETVLHHGSSRQFDAKSHQRTPFYAGFVMADPTNSLACGNWSVAAAQAAERDIEIPLSRVFVRALREKGLRLTMSIAACKLQRALYKTNTVSASWWTYAYYAEHQPNSPHLDDLMKFSLREESTVHTFRLIVLGMMAIVLALSIARERAIGREAGGVLLFAIALFVGHAVIFSLFEFNPRYLIPAFGLLSLSFLLFGHEVILEPVSPRKLEK